MLKINAEELKYFINTKSLYCSNGICSDMTYNRCCKFCPHNNECDETCEYTHYNYCRDWTLDKEEEECDDDNDYEDDDW